jgi:hypothetical protein
VKTIGDTGMAFIILPFRVKAKKIFTISPRYHPDITTIQSISYFAEATVTSATLPYTTLVIIHTHTHTHTHTTRTSKNDLNHIMSDKLEDVPEPAVATATDVTVVAGNTTDESSAKSQDQEFIAKVCAWVAFILINSAFLALISWGSFTRWVIGFSLCIVYVILLLIAGILLKRRNDGKDTVLTSLIFLVAVIATAATGVYLPLNVFPCGIDPYYYYSYDDNDITNNYQWVTETGDLPSEVQSWWEDGYSYGNNNKNFMYLNTTGVTLFGGTYGQSYVKYLYRVENGNAPEPITEILDPQEFVLVDDALACFIFESSAENSRGKSSLHRWNRHQSNRGNLPLGRRLVLFERTSLVSIRSLFSEDRLWKFTAFHGSILSQRSYSSQFCGRWFYG